MSILKRLFNLARAEFQNITQGEREVSEEFWQFFKQQPDYKQYQSHFDDYRHQYQRQTSPPPDDFSGNRGYNPYQALNVSPTDKWEDIEKAYRKAARQYHPDRFQTPGERETATQVMAIINASYAFLKQRHKNK